MSKQVKGNLMLLLAAMIWGAAFVAQSIGMDYVEPYTFLFCRCILGGLVLLPVIYFMRSKKEAAAPAPYRRRDLWLSSILCGTILFVATTLQQFGLLYTTAGKSGFITTLYVVLVPVLGLFFRRRVRLTVWIGVILAAVSLYLLCLNESFTIGPGELLTMGCSLCFACHIMTIDHFSGRVDGVKMSCIQFFVCGVWSGLFMLITEKPVLNNILQCWLPICYAGILSCGVGYTLQILAQRNTNPTVASLLMSTESVFAVLFGAILLAERLTLQEYLGCALMFCAIILAQLPQKNKAGNCIQATDVV